MSLFTLPQGDAYDKRCGEVFLTLNGNIIFHCTLCENKYKGIHEYAVHIIDKHFDPAILEEDCFSTNSSDFFEDENTDDNAEMRAAGTFDAVLFEEVEQLESAFQVEQEDEVFENDAKESTETYQKISSIKIENSKPKPTKQRRLQRNETKMQYLRMKTRKPQPKVHTVAEKIRLVNEEAAACLELPTFKQPLPRGNIPDSERKYKCNFCGFAFKDESNLIAHIKRHSGKKNFQCTYCSKMFCTRTEIEEHSRRHTGEKPFQCTFESCSKTYFTRSELNMHIKRHKNERNYKCEVCQRAFYDRSDLREHFVSHTQERNHECMVCHAKFLRRKALVNHIKLHENKREYECNICGATFNQKPGLNSHMKTRHKDINN